MLILDTHKIGDKLYHFRKRSGMTQAEAAEAAGLSDRTYADIERGSVNMRVETMLRICSVFQITPNDILTDNSSEPMLHAEELIEQLRCCNSAAQESALKILSIFLNSIQKHV